MASYHVRSTSLPSTSHPLVVNAEERLERLKSSQATSSSSICHNMSGLVELYDSVDDVLQLSKTSLHEKRVEEEVLDGSLRLLDFCGSIRDALSQMKENVQELESSFRRKRSDTGFSNEVNAYMISKNKLNKLIYKSLVDLKRMELSCSTRSLEKGSLSFMFGEIEEISLAVFNYVLTFISQPKGRSKSLSFVSWLLHSKRVSCEREEYISEVENLDIDLLVFKSKSSKKDINLQQVQTMLKKMHTFGMNIQELEAGMEAIFRRLVKTRVSLLNIFNN